MHNRRNRNLIVFLIILIALILLIWFEGKRKSPYLKITYSSIEDFHPKITTDFNQIIKQNGFQVSFNKKFNLANYVIYLLTENKVKSKVCKRQKYFTIDRNISGNSISSSEYTNSGYDRGHLVPAADMLWSKEAMKSSFKMSNIVPQLHSFNNGIWKEIEKMVRDWAILDDSLIVISGPLFKQIIDTIGKSEEVVVPKFFFKVVMDISAPKYKGIAFLVDQTFTSNEIFDHAISIDSLEILTGFDFFPSLDTRIIERIEKQFKKSDWIAENY